MLYTKKGDDGQTSKFDGSRLNKDDLLIEALGSLDETSSFLGLCKIKAESFGENIIDISLINILEKVQDNLFLIQSNLAGKEIKNLDLNVPEIENSINELEKTLPPLNKFLKADGNELALLLNYERTLVRKTERVFISLCKKSDLANEKETKVYLNRLSDLFFVLFRFVNFSTGQKEKYF